MRLWMKTEPQEQAGRVDETREDAKAESAAACQIV